MTSSEHELPDVSPPEPQKERWVSRNGFTVVTIVTVLIVIVGTTIVLIRAAQYAPRGSLQSWNKVIGDGYLPSLPLPNESAQQAPAPVQPPQMQDVQAPLFAPTGGTSSPLYEPSTLFTQKKQSSDSVQRSTELLSDIYELIPSSFLSVSTMSKRTMVQERLYEYGNAIGFLIQQFERDHETMVRVLKDQLEDPDNQEKRAAAEKLAVDLSSLGKTIEAVTAPTEAGAAAHALAKSYRDLGEKLSLVLQARYDKDKVDAVLTYNETVHAFVENYIALAGIFSAAGVGFSPTDPGSVFAFSPL